MHLAIAKIFNVSFSTSLELNIIHYATRRMHNNKIITRLANTITGTRYTE